MCDDISYTDNFEDEFFNNIFSVAPYGKNEMEIEIDGKSVNDFLLNMLVFGCKFLYNKTSPVQLTEEEQLTMSKYFNSIGYTINYNIRENIYVDIFFKKNNFTNF